MHKGPARQRPSEGLFTPRSAFIATIAGTTDLFDIINCQRNTVRVPPRRYCGSPADQGLSHNMASCVLRPAAIICGDWNTNHTNLFSGCFKIVRISSCRRISSPPLLSHCTSLPFIPCKDAVRTLIAECQFKTGLPHSQFAPLVTHTLPKDQFFSAVFLAGRFLSTQAQVPGCFVENMCSDFQKCRILCIRECTRADRSSVKTSCCVC